MPSPAGTLAGAVASLDPADKPVDPVAKFDYTAGHNGGDKGTLQFTQTGQRGIGVATLEFTVCGGLTVSVDGSFHINGLGNAFDGRASMASLKLRCEGEGFYRGTGTIVFLGKHMGYDCEGDVREERPVDVWAQRDEARPSVVQLKFAFDAFDNKLPTVNIRCRNGQASVPYNTEAPSWARLVSGSAVTIGETATVQKAGMTGAANTSSTTRITVSSN